MRAADGVEIVAMGDLFPDRLASSMEHLKELVTEEPELAPKLKVDPDRMFSGFDAYRRVIDADVDLVIIATPPTFRPQHVEAAVRAGKHIFMEKPVAVDAAGVRSIMASADLAAERGLGIVAGTQRRHHAGYLDVIGRIHDGAMGEVLSGQVFWNQGGLWKADREKDWSDTEWQIRNWLYFTWLSGDHIVEQHIHNLDVANWVIGSHPIRATGVGGRQWRTGPEYGHIYDHFAIDFEYPNGARVLSMCRQIDGTASHVGEHFIGTRGTTNAASWIDGGSGWRHEAARPEVSPYQQEHTDLIASIRAGTPLNEGRQVAESTLTAIMGREAAYTGQVIEWDVLLTAEQQLKPPQLAFGPLAVPPVPMPGITTLERTWETP